MIFFFMSSVDLLGQQYWPVLANQPTEDLKNYMTQPSCRNGCDTLYIDGNGSTHVVHRRPVDVVTPEGGLERLRLVLSFPPGLYIPVPELIIS